MEPTQRPPACLEELGFEWAREAFRVAYRGEHDYLAFTGRVGDLEVSLVVFVGVDCLRLLGAFIEGCGEAAGRVLEAADWPEVSRVDVEGECARAVVPAAPPYRVEAALRRLGAPWPLEPEGVKALDPYDVEDAFPEVQG